MPRDNLGPKPPIAREAARKIRMVTSIFPMPPWVAFVPRSTSLLKRRGIERLPLALQHCHSAIPRPSQLLHARIRSISAQLSPTAVNARPNIPPRNVELHNALSELGSSAETFVNATRLQLALKGLETQDAIVRVAGGFRYELGSVQS